MARLIAFGLGLLLCLPAPVLAQRASKTGYVKTGKFVNFRVSPKVRSKLIRQIPRNVTFQVLKSGIPSQDTGSLKKKWSAWTMVSYKGQTGYVASYFVGLGTPPVATPTPANTGDTIRVAYDKSKSYQWMPPSTFKDKQVLLTFDDGPRIGVTDKILDLLKQYKIKAVFFVNGYRIRACRRKKAKLIERMYREGHIVANHTDRHRTLSKASSYVRKQEIENCDKEIHQEFKSFGAVWKPVLFRFPSGAWRHKSGIDLRKEVHRKYKLVVCSPSKIHGTDWVSSKSSAQILAKLKLTTNYHKKGIVVLHEKAESAAALDSYLAWLVKNGYKFVSLKVDGSVAPTPTPTPSPGAPQGVPTVNVTRYLKVTRYNKLYYRWGNHYGIDWRLMKAIAIVESAEKAHVVNRFGYTGIFQIGKMALKTFNKRVKTNWTMADMKNAAKNTRVAARSKRSSKIVLSRPTVLGTQFMSDPLRYAVAMYCCHNYGIGITKRTIEKHRKDGKPMTFNAVFNAVEAAGKARYGAGPGAAKMRVAKKVGAIYLEFLKKLPAVP